jgi:hypothetical protein
MTTLIEFLRTRYDEEQRDAEAAYDGDGYREWDIPCTGVVQVAGGDLDGLVVAPRNAAIHVARHDPARVLADVAAKRWLVDRAEHVMASSRDHAEATAWLHVVQRLATVYADHPDYDPAWQPAEVTT